MHHELSCPPAEAPAQVGLATKSEAKATEEYDALKASADAQIEAYARGPLGPFGECCSVPAPGATQSGLQYPATGKHRAKMAFKCIYSVVI